MLIHHTLINLRRLLFARSFADPSMPGGVGVKLVFDTGYEDFISMEEGKRLQDYLGQVSCTAMPVAPGDS